MEGGKKEQLLSYITLADCDGRSILCIVRYPLPQTGPRSRDLCIAHAATQSSLHTEGEKRTSRAILLLYVLHALYTAIHSSLDPRRHFSRSLKRRRPGASLPQGESA
jgi:hypothetical protein